jgi:hypothetical protein
VPVAPTTTNTTNRTRVDNRQIYIPAIVPQSLPSQVAAGAIIRETTSCGPLQSVVKTPVTGTYYGTFRKRQVELGFTYDLQPFTDEAGREVVFHEVITGAGQTRLFGHQAIIYSTVAGVSGTRNLAVGGGGSNGDWGQAGGGGSVAAQRLVTHIQLRLCDAGTQTIN